MELSRTASGAIARTRILKGEELKGGRHSWLSLQKQLSSLVVVLLD